MIEQLERQLNMRIYPRSVTEADGVTYFLARDGGRKWLGIKGDSADFEGEKRGEIMLCPLTPENAAALRGKLAWLKPQILGLRKSAGCGDRLGLATPGHIRAVRAVGDIAPILAQQSMRENARTGRTPQEVLDDAMWGVFQEGWREPWGADADHLKTTADIDRCFAAGYTFYTIDPGDHVDNAAHTAPYEELREEFKKLPWEELKSDMLTMRVSYLDRTFSLDDGTVLEFDDEMLLRAACKYGRAIAHTKKMFWHLVRHTQKFDLEMSVDETETPTSVAEHFFIASELKRLRVQWVSLAPRYVGRFEKGVDYIGDLQELENSLKQHAAVARELGPYKLSIHSGSDKFSVYPIIARVTDGMVHLKTAGTSYLEALRAVAQVKPNLFRQIMAYGIERYPEDRATYHVSAELAKIPALPSHIPPTSGGEQRGDMDLPKLLDQFDARQVLHVTFGSALDRFGAELKDVLREHEDEHYAALEAHFRKHLEPLSKE